MIEPQDVTVATQSPEVQANDNPQVVDNQDDGVESEVETEGTAQEEQVELSIEERLEKVEKERVAYEKKIKRQTAAYSDLQRKYESTMQQMQQVKPVEKQPDLQEPKIEDFDTLSEFQTARDKFIEDKTKRTLEQELTARQRQQQMQQAQAQRNEIFQKSKQVALQKYPDFVRAENEVDSFLQIAAKGGDISSLSIIAEQIYDDPDTIGEVVYYFGANNGERLDELEVISKLPPRKAAIELYKLQQKLKGAPPQAKPKQQLPQPAKRVSATGSTKKDLFDGDVLKNLGLKK
jgi:hypothetical protein